MGLTLRPLSELAGVSASYLWRIENGERRPSASVLCRLAKPLGFTELEILKLAGYLLPDKTDERIARFKNEIKGEITLSMTKLLDRVDRL